MPPKAFEDCVSAGGRVRTKRVNARQYMHVCLIGGKSYAGEVKTRKGEPAKGMKKK